MSSISSNNPHLCPHCSGRILVLDEHLGKVVRCGACQKLLSVPEAPIVIPAVPAAGQPLPGAIPDTPPIAEPARRKKHRRPRRGRNDFRSFEEEVDENGETILVERAYGCPFCDCPERPHIERRMPGWAWWLVGVGVIFWPLLIIGLLMREDHAVCPECRRVIGVLGNSGLL